MEDIHSESSREDRVVVGFVVFVPIAEVFQLEEACTSHSSVLVVCPGDQLVETCALM
jgi:hypothetical protein